MHKEYTFYFCNPLHFLLNFYIMKKIFVFFFVFLTLAALFCAFQMKKRVNSVSQNDQTTLIEIPNGTPASRVGEILSKKGIWTDELAYKVWNKLKQPSIQKGWYEIPPHVTLDDIAAILASGKTATRRVTIPEGRASWEIPAYLKKAFPDLNEDRWNKLVHDAKFAKSLGVDAKSLEGYLLPDTYPFPIDANEETILRQMVAANLKFRDQLEADPRPSKWKELGNWHRVLTLASVVEEETGIPEERPLIAGVFHNRLKLQEPDRPHLQEPAQQQQPVQHPQVQGAHARPDFEPRAQSHRSSAPSGRNRSALLCCKRRREHDALLQQDARRPQQVQGYRREEPRRIRLSGHTCLASQDCGVT